MINRENGNIILKQRIKQYILYIILILLALYTLMPMVFLIINSFKSQAEIIRNPLALPKELDLNYLTNAFESLNFLRAGAYTIIITVISLFFIVFSSALAGWMLARYKSRTSNFVYLMFTAAMLIPFQAVMYPLMNIMDFLNLKNVMGLTIMYTGFGLSMSTFLYSGFYKSISVSLEEAALVDGANIFQIFFYITFPLVKPTTITVLILNGMWIWNDYLLPFLTLGTSDQKTLVLQLYYAKMLSGQFGSPWELIFPAVLICTIPLIVIFLFLQKHFVKGVSEGAVKG